MNLRPASFFLFVHFFFLIKKSFKDFHGGAVQKNPPAIAGDMGLNPGLGWFHMPLRN